MGSPNGFSTEPAMALPPGRGPFVLDAQPVAGHNHPVRSVEIGIGRVIRRKEYRVCW